MKHKNLIKIIFDIIMLVLFALLYNTHTTGMSFHEIGGLVLFSLFVVHLIYNKKWIINVSKRVFNRGYNAKQRFMYILNILLLISFILVGISGVVISRIIFVGMFTQTAFWLPLHIASALISLLLIAIHVGVHFKFIINTLKKHLTIKNIFISKFLVTMLIIIGIYGTFNLISSNIPKLIPKTDDSTKEHPINEGEDKPESSFSLISLTMSGGIVISTVLMFAAVTYRIEERKQARR